MSLVYWFLILNLWILKASSLQPGSRALLRALADNNGGGTDLKDYAVELNATDFDVVLKDTPATYAVVEFFAHWFYAGNDQPGRMKCNSIVKVVLKQLRAQRPRNNKGRMSTQIFQPRPKDENSRKGYSSYRNILNYS